MSPNQSTAADTSNPVPAEWLEHIGLNVQLPLLNLLFDFKTSLLNVLGYWAAGYTLGFQLQIGGVSLWIRQSTAIAAIQNDLEDYTQVKAKIQTILDGN